MGYNEYNMDYRYHQDLGMLAYSGSDENIPCEGIGINSNSTSSCCPLEWCEQIPAITVPQFICGWLIGTLGYAYSTAFTISLISKLLDPQKQVCIRYGRIKFDILAECTRIGKYTKLDVITS